MQKQKIIAIIGPTGAGKTALSINLAKKFNGEIISADSMQIYKDLNIGTAKITDSEKQGIEHHLLDFVEPNKNFSVAEWKFLAEQKIVEISKKGKLPIIVGGTGLYVNALINDFKFGNETTKQASKTDYQEYLNANGQDALWQLLYNKCPTIANNTSKNKTRAIIRYLQIIDNGGDPLKVDNSSKYNSYIIALDVPREVLYNNINLRVDQMIADGLEQEFKNAVKKYNLKPDNQASLAIGYREFFGYVNGEYNLDRVIELIKQHSRNYAKRQMTYFRKMNDVNWFNKTDVIKIQNAVQNFLNT